MIVESPSPLRSVAEAETIAARIQSMVDSGAIDAAIAMAADEAARAQGEARAVLLRAAAVALNTAGRSVVALRAAATARDGFRQAGNRAGEVDALVVIGAVMRSAGDHASAIQSLEEAETLARQLDDAHRIGAVLRQVGISYSIIGRHQQALSALGEAVTIHARQAERRDHLNTMLSLYNARNRLASSLPKDAPERIQSLEEHLDRWKALADDAADGGFARIELMALGNLAITLHDTGRHREALHALDALMPRYREHGMGPTRRSAGSRWAGPTSRSATSRPRACITRRPRPGSRTSDPEANCETRSKGSRTSTSRSETTALR